MIDIFATHQVHRKRPAKKYTANQVRRRQKAVKLGYILHPDKSDEDGHRYALYYDESTKRDDKFERASWRAGFQILKWIER